MPTTTFARAAAWIGASLLATTCALSVQNVQASPLHHRHARLVIPHTDFNAYASPGGPPVEVAPSPVMGTWRFGLLRHGCGHGYPMSESAGCGTATGGPAGGIN